MYDKMFRNARQSIRQIESLAGGEKNLALRRTFNAAVLAGGRGPSEEGQSAAEGSEAARLRAALQSARDRLRSARDRRPPPPPPAKNTFFCHPDIESYFSKGIANIQRITNIPVSSRIYDDSTQTIVGLREAIPENMTTFRSQIHRALDSLIEMQEKDKAKELEAKKQGIPYRFTGRMMDVSEEPQELVMYASSCFTPPSFFSRREKLTFINMVLDKLNILKSHANKLYVYHGEDYSNAAGDVDTKVIVQRGISYTFYMENE